MAKNYLTRSYHKFTLSAQKINVWPYRRLLCSLRTCQVDSNALNCPEKVVGRWENLGRIAKINSRSESARAFLYLGCVSSPPRPRDGPSGLFCARIAPKSLLRVPCITSYPLRVEMWRWRWSSVPSQSPPPLAGAAVGVLHRVAASSASGMTSLCMTSWQESLRMSSLPPGNAARTAAFEYPGCVHWFPLPM